MRKLTSIPASLAVLALVASQPAAATRSGDALPAIGVRQIVDARDEALREGEQCLFPSNA